MSPSPSRKSSPHNPPNVEDSKMEEQNCKAQNEEIRQTFEKFGKITYFEIKRKPQDVVYAFIEYSTHQQASEAVSKMDKTIFMKRTLNVQFGKGGKHQQTHYKTLRVPSPRHRDFNSRDREIRERRSSSSHDRYENGRKSDKMTRRGSRSPTRNYDRSRKDYRDERSKQRYRDDRRRENSRERGEDRYDSKRRHDDYKDNRRDDKRYPEKYSPQRGDRKHYDNDKYPERKYEDKRHHDEFYRGKERPGHEDYERRDKPRYEDERRKRSPDHHERNRDKYLDHHRKQRRSRSPGNQEYSRSHRGRQDERRPFEDRQKERRERDDYSRERERENRRSRSRDKSPQKHKSHRREKYEDSSARRQGHRHQRQSPRGRRSPRSPRRDEDRKRRHSRSEERRRRHSRSEDRRRKNSRSYSPYGGPEERKYPERNNSSNPLYRNEEFKRYPHQHQHHYVRNQRPYENKQQPFPREKEMQESMGFRKNSRVSHQSKEMSPQKQSMLDENQKNMRFSSDKEVSPRPAGMMHGQLSV